MVFSWTWKENKKNDMDDDSNAQGKIGSVGVLIISSFFFFDGDDGIPELVRLICTDISAQASYQNYDDHSMRRYSILSARQCAGAAHPDSKYIFSSTFHFGTVLYGTRHPHNRTQYHSFPTQLQ